MHQCMVGNSSNKAILWNSIHKSECSNILLLYLLLEVHQYMLFGPMFPSNIPDAHQPAFDSSPFGPIMRVLFVTTDTILNRGHELAGFNETWSAKLWCFCLHNQWVQTLLCSHVSQGHGFELLFFPCFQIKSSFALATFLIEGIRIIATMHWSKHLCAKINNCRWIPYQPRRTRRYLILQWNFPSRTVLPPLAHQVSVSAQTVVRRWHFLVSKSYRSPCAVTCDSSELRSVTSVSNFVCFHSPSFCSCDDLTTTTLLVVISPILFS